MKNGEVLELYETLERIKQNKELKFNVKLGYAITKNKEILRKEAQIIYDMRREILLEHGTIEGTDIIVPKEFARETNQKINDLMEIENNVNIILVPLEAFEEMELNIEDIEGLIGMIQPMKFTGPPIYEEIDG